MIPIPHSHSLWEHLLELFLRRLQSKFEMQLKQNCHLHFSLNFPCYVCRLAGFKWNYSTLKLQPRLNFPVGFVNFSLAGYCQRFFPAAWSKTLRKYHKAKTLFTHKQRKNEQSQIHTHTYRYTDIDTYAVQCSLFADLCNFRLTIWCVYVTDISSFRFDHLLV